MSSSSPREIELKLELDVGDVPRLRALLDECLGVPDGTAQLRSVYYDTPERDLAAGGVSLRVRSGGDTLVQTVKRARNAGSGFFERDEWETPLAAREPDLDAFTRTPAGAAFQGKAAQLAPLFETRIERTTWQASRGSSLIEVALDAGRVVAGRRTERMAELELELKQGEPADLFHLLRRLGEVGSLRPGTEAKSERGYRLSRGKPRRASKAEPVRLDRHMTAASAFQAIVRGCLRHFGKNVPLVVEGRAPEALHQARVALRRLRSALSLFKDLVADTPYDDLRRALQDVSRELGEARNLDVYLAESARPEMARDGQEPGVRAFVAEIERRRTAAYDAAVARLQSSAFHELLLRLVEWTEAGPWLLDPDKQQAAARQRPARAIAAEILSKRRRRVKRRGRHLAALDPEARHRVRIEAKKLRYASEFFAGLVQRPKAAKRHAAFAAALEELQQHLGDLNDIQTGHEIALSFAAHAGREPGSAGDGVFAASHVSGRQEARTDELLKAAEHAHAQLTKTKRFWSAWRD